MWRVTTRSAQKYVQLLAVSLSSIKQYYDEKYDRGNFIKNVILDNILPGDIYLKARELRFNSDVSRVVHADQDRYENGYLRLRYGAESFPG